MPRKAASTPPGSHAIGGVFAAPARRETTGGGENGGGDREQAISLWQHWCGGADRVHGLRNARSALNHALRHLSPARVWLPAYACPELISALQGTGAEPRFYAVGPDMAPDTGWLDLRLRPGDAAIGINYFGRPSETLGALAKARTDVHWIEDCAQSLDTGVPAWAPLRLYSPRKLLGVPDGGLLVDTEGRLPPPATRAPASACLRRPGLQRRDLGERENERWYAAFREAEAVMTVSDHALSALTLRLLHATALAPLAAARRRNYARLNVRLAGRALFPEDDPSWAPLGYPLRVARSEAVVARLAHARIFAPRHWRRLATPDPPAFERELARQLVTLPCDHRYGDADMDRLLSVLAEVEA